MPVGPGIVAAREGQPAVERGDGPVLQVEPGGRPAGARRQVEGLDRRAPAGGADTRLAGLQVGRRRSGP